MMINVVQLAIPQTETRVTITPLVITSFVTSIKGGEYAAFTARYRN